MPDSITCDKGADGLFNCEVYTENQPFKAHFGIKEIMSVQSISNSYITDDEYSADTLQSYCNIGESMHCNEFSKGEGMGRTLQCKCAPKGMEDE